MKKYNLRPYLTRERGLVKVQVRARTPMGLVNVNMGRHPKKMADDIACYADALRRHVAEERELDALKLMRSFINGGNSVELAFDLSI